MKLFKSIFARVGRKKKINAIHARLNSVVMDLHALSQVDDAEMKHNIKMRAMMNIKAAKCGMSALGLD